MVQENVVVQSKRTFLKVIAISAITALSYKLFFTSKDYSLLQTLLEDLFPFNHDKLHTKQYIQTILHHPRIIQSQKDFFKECLTWLEKETKQQFQTSYAKLSKQKREQILQRVTKETWGEQFVSDLLGYIFEALLGDPIYGINSEEIGWRWLGFTPGSPRPKEVFLG